MDLHPNLDLLAKIRDRNLDRLEFATAALDAAVQEVYAQKSIKCHPRDLHGQVLAVNVRDAMFWWTALPTFRRQGFMVEERTSRSLLLIDPEFTKIRLRKHPRRRRHGVSELSPVVAIESLDPLHGQLDLFGEQGEVEPLQWEPALLWDADPETQTLRAAWLGALEKDPSNPRVFGRVDIPMGSPSLFSEDLAATQKSDPQLDFDDLFGEEAAGDFLA
ncbi:hypothetical protein [Micromonospora echinofusca]|uniref:hypothetical protein n=1 Tax=Micromonospora echinofusca TaxID=47858 RepID=UPI0033FB2E02